MPAAPKVISSKPNIPTLWLDTSVAIKLAKLAREEKLEHIEQERGNRLRDLVSRLAERRTLLCPEADQEEEYQAERLEREIAAVFSRLSVGIRLRHRQGILDSQIFHGMKAYCEGADEISLPLNVYFHRDPIRQMEETLRRGLIFDVSLNLDQEILSRRAAAKGEVFERIGRLREELVERKQTYDAQLKLELQSHADSIVTLLATYAAKAKAGDADFWDLMSIVGPSLYLAYWKQLNGKPPGLEGIGQFFRSPWFSNLPIWKIRAQLFADILTGKEKFLPGDPMDAEALSVAIAMSHYVLTDRKMENRIKRIGIDAEWGTKVFSMSTVDGLFKELERL